ncbi:MAG: gliding motility lipoprotein GldH [Cytophagaceae bacterium]
MKVHYSTWQLNSSFIQMKALLSGLLIFSLLTFSSCDSLRVYEQNIDLPEEGWEEQNPLIYEFQIPDHRIGYNVLYNVRYAIDYPYYNLYVKYSIMDSTGKEIEQRLQGMDLMDSKTGKPFGDGIGSIFDYRIVALPNYPFPYTGKYYMKVTQYMRENPVKGIISFGLRIEKIK